MNLKNKVVLILGYGKSGQSSLEFLLKKHAKVFVYDQNCDVKNMVKNAIFVQNITEQFVQQLDLAVLSPGISIYSEQAKLCQLFGVKVISELQLGLNYAKGKQILVTGTNGKTTTVNLINQAFNYAKKSNKLVGNVGVPITASVSPFKTTYIVETSSFQLESSLPNPDIACILNISPNHLDRHFSMENYIQTKYRIFKNMKKGYLILNADDLALSKLTKQKTKPKIVWFSATKQVLGAFCKDDDICFDNGKKVVTICKKSDIKLFGEHNTQNVLAMVAICMSYGLKPKHIALAIQNFRGVEHRLQLVLEQNNVKFINDSKSTTPASTITAIDSFSSPIIVILGGSDKQIDYDDFALNIKDKIKLAVLTGQIATNLEKSFKNAKAKNYVVIKDFYSAVSYAKKIAQSKDVVLLSPATASFDSFKNFEQRGEEFVKIIKNE